MIAIADLEKRFMKDPEVLRLGAVASDLARLSCLARSGTSLIAIQNILTEVKLFTEWAAREADLEIQENLLLLQRHLVRWNSFELHKKEIANETEKWSNTILKISGLI